MGFIKRSIVKDFLQERDLRTSKELYSSLDNQVSAMLARAAARASQNRRKTVTGIDL